MAASTVSSSDYSKLLVFPPATSSGPTDNNNNRLLSSMRFDEDAFERNYHMCRGGGRGHGYCVNRFMLGAAQQTHKTQELFEKELVDSVECMSYVGPGGDTNRCQHYIEGLHSILHHKQQNPTKTQNIISFFRKFRNQEIQT
eukprot:GHVS01090083.1.p1 GENE.GHVS01090083.1~~GHVS01090083.1.p1  ORF type:complete len:142 (+),score=24.62 GHVS01090083.1:129-554(+)